MANFNNDINILSVIYIDNCEVALLEMHNSKGDTIRVLSNGKTMLKLD